MRLIAAIVLAVLFLAAPGVVRAQDAPPPGQCFTTEQEFIASAVSVKVVEAQSWIAFLVDLGLSMDDFKPERAA